jgi:hypothetical protein
MQDEDREPVGHSQHDAASTVADNGAPAAIDIALLAAKVRRLMHEELRLDKARGANVPYQRG